MEAIAPSSMIENNKSSIPLKLNIYKDFDELLLTLLTIKSLNVQFSPIRELGKIKDFELICDDYTSVRLVDLLGEFGVEASLIKHMSIEMIYSDSTDRITDIRVFTHEETSGPISKMSLNASKETTFMDDVGDLISDGLEAVFEVCT